MVNVEIMYSLLTILELTVYSSLDKVDESHYGHVCTFLSLGGLWYVSNVIFSQCVNQMTVIKCCFISLYLSIHLFVKTFELFF